MLDKREWEDECRAARAGAQMVGITIMVVAAGLAALLIAWPRHVSSMMLAGIGLGFVVAAFGGRIGWGARFTSAALGIAMLYLGARLTIHAFTGVW